MTRTLFIGRFQPFHLGHFDCLKQILDREKYLEILIGIGSSQEELTIKNPFSFYERKKMLEEIFETLKTDYANTKFSIYAIPDFGNDEKWTQYILDNLPEFQMVFSGNHNTLECFTKFNHQVFPLKIRENIKATEIRKFLSQKNPLWKKLVPQPIKTYLIEIKAEKRLAEIFKIQKSIQNFKTSKKLNSSTNYLEEFDLKSNKDLEQDNDLKSQLTFSYKNKESKKQKIVQKTQKKDILLVEKWTDLEYLRKHAFNQVDWNNYNKRLDKQHQEHLFAKKSLLKILQKNQISFEIIKDDQFDLVDYNNYKAVLSLGGDGTFLHAAKNVKNQLMIGVNSQISKSVGYLTNFNLKNYEILVTNLKNYLSLNLEKENSTKILNIKKWPRIGVKINNQKVDFVAINEVYIGVPEIYKTSHFEVKIDQKNTYFASNGFILSTFQGSSAFYKSSGGKEFKESQFAYISVLTYLQKGDLPNNLILENSRKVQITPQRLGHNLIFDSDPSRQISLKQDDILEVYIDKKNYLKILS